MNYDVFSIWCTWTLLTLSHCGLMMPRNRWPILVQVRQWPQQTIIWINTDLLSMDPLWNSGKLWWKYDNFNWKNCIYKCCYQYRRSFCSSLAVLDNDTCFFAAEIDIHKYVKHMLTQNMLTWNKLCLAIHTIFIDQMGWCSRNQHMFILPQVPEHSLLHAKCIHEKHLTMLFAKCRHFASMS